MKEVNYHVFFQSNKLLKALEKDFWQTSHIKGFSPVCIVLCRERVQKIEKKTHCIYHRKRVSLQYGVSNAS